VNHCKNKVAILLDTISNLWKIKGVRAILL